MGFKNLSSSKETPFIDNLVAQKKLDKPVFSFKLNETGSELFIGGTNSKLYKGSFTYIPVSEKVSLCHTYHLTVSGSYPKNPL